MKVVFLEQNDQLAHFEWTKVAFVSGFFLSKIFKRQFSIEKYFKTQFWSGKKIKSNFRQLKTTLKIIVNT